MKITKHAQSCFLLETVNKKVLIDPGTYIFGKEGLTPKSFTDIDVIIITHEHLDHFDWKNIKEIIKRDKSTILGTIAIKEKVQTDFPEIDFRVINQKVKHDFGSINVEGFLSKHGPLPNGGPAPEVSGVVIDDGDTRFYTPGDSLILNKDTNAKIIAVPICGTVTMDINQAKTQLIELKPELVIPMHYDNPIFPVDVNDFKKAMSDTRIEVRILENSQTIEI